MAKRPESQLVLAALELVDADFMREAECWFGGGTAVALRCDEFRISHDIDFLCSSRAGYRLLRQRVHAVGVQAIFAAEVKLIREVRADRYGVRFVLDIDGQALKFEVVSEGRVDLQGVKDESLPVARLADADMVAEKLLANADRFLDDSALARDAIDLILLENALGGLPKAAWTKARAAYGTAIDDAYRRALEHLRDEPTWRKKAIDTLSVTSEAIATIEAKLGALAPGQR